jgi:hypothetical protein
MISMGRQQTGTVRLEGSTLDVHAQSVLKTKEMKFRQALVPGV